MKEDNYAQAATSRSPCGTAARSCRASYGIEVALRITYLYLLLPFILFCLGWLRLVIHFPFSVCVLGNLAVMEFNVSETLEKVRETLGTGIF